MDILKGFQDYLSKKDRSHLTIRGYVADIGQFQRWFQQTNGEAFDLVSVTPTDIREYRQYLQVTEQRKANTVNRKMAALSTLMVWAKTCGKISSDPTEGIKPVGQTRSAIKWLDKKEQFALQRAIEQDLQLAQLRYPKRWITRRRDASMVLFLFNTGLRLSELVSLRLTDIQLSERKGVVLIRQGKGNKQRRVDLNSVARKSLQEWLDVRPTTSSEFLWVAVESASERLSGRTVQRVLKRYAQEAHLDELTPHVARHTFAKNLVNSGVGLEIVAGILGHNSVDTTAIYTKPGQKDMQQAVERIVLR